MRSGSSQTLRPSSRPRSRKPHCAASDNRTTSPTLWRFLSPMMRWVTGQSIGAWRRDVLIGQRRVIGEEDWFEAPYASCEDCPHGDGKNFGDGRNGQP